MKFSEISKEQWEELSPYLDTCLLPVTGMVDPLQPYEATERLEQLRDLLDLIEIPFKGRVVTYPAWHYIYDSENFAVHVEQWCASVKQAGFRYVIVVTPNMELVLDCPSVDLCFRPTAEGQLPLQADVSNTIRSLWSGQAT
jgi:23S rRNA (pseudouridine1915-N3)-methyltransferase